MICYIKIESGCYCDERTWRFTNQGQNTGKHYLFGDRFGIVFTR